MPLISTCLPVAGIGVPFGSVSRPPVCVPTKRPLVGERVALLDEAPHGVVDVRDRLQLLREPLADRVAALEDAVGHLLDGVLGVEVHDPVEIARVVALDITVE